jgi:hypothetical protein
MSTVDVEEAVGISKWLTRREASGPGDMENAWHRLENRYGLPWRTFWALRYRPPRIICSVLLERFRAAHQAERDRQMKKLQHELTITEKITGADSPAIRAAKTLLGADQREVKSSVSPEIKGGK